MDPPSKFASSLLNVYRQPIPCSFASSFWPPVPRKYPSASLCFLSYLRPQCARDLPPVDSNSWICPSDVPIISLFSLLSIIVLSSFLPPLMDYFYRFALFRPSHMTSLFQPPLRIMHSAIYCFPRANFTPSHPYFGILFFDRPCLASSYVRFQETFSLFSAGSTLSVTSTHCLSYLVLGASPFLPFFFLPIVSLSYLYILRFQCFSYFFPVC